MALIFNTFNSGSAKIGERASDNNYYELRLGGEAEEKLQSQIDGSEFF